MGNHTSRPGTDWQESRRRPSTRPVRQCAQPIEPRQRPVCKDNLGFDLQHMDAYLHKSNKRITILGVGRGWGLLKGYILSQGGFEYPGGNLKRDQNNWLKLAIVDLEKHKKSPMWNGWLYDDSSVRFPPELYEVITKQSIDEGNYYFKSALGGLQVLCEPLEYTICVKLDEIHENYFRKNASCPSYYKFEVADYLSGVVRKRGDGKVSLQEIFKWGKLYQKPVNEAVLHKVMEHSRVHKGLVMTDNESGNKLVSWFLVPKSVLKASQSNNHLIRYREISKVLDGIQTHSSKRR